MLTLTRRSLFATVPALALIPRSGFAATKELKVIYAFYSDATAGIFKTLIASYQKANPDVTVTAEEIGWDNLQQRLTTDIAGGTNPDIAVIATRWILDYAKQNIAEPLDGYISPAYKAGFFDSLLGPSSVDGKLWGLPFDASTRALYYNIDLLEQAGVSAPPATWADLRQTAGKVKLAGKAYGFGLQGKEIETDTYWYYPLWTHGGNIIENGKSGVASSAAIEATKLYKGLIDDGLTQPSPTAYNRQDVETLFKQGRAATIITGPWLMGQLKSEAPHIKYKVSPIPKATMEATWSGTDSVIMFAKSKNKKLAWDFMSQAMVTPASTLDLTLKEGFLPTTHSAADNSEVKAEFGAFTALLPVAKFAPQVPDWPQVVDVTIAALQRVYLGQQTAETALTAAAAKINEIIA